jgi:thiamine biosynthesis lipoprotein
MGTSLYAAVVAPSRAEGIHAIDHAFAAVRRLDSLLSTWHDDSEIARLNQAAPHYPVSISAELHQWLQEAARWTRLTQDAFDPSVGALVDAWDLRGQGRVPSSGRLQVARSSTGLRHFVFNRHAGTAMKTKAGAWIDTGGFGKGVALREAGQVLIREGVHSAILNFGGQVLALGADRDGSDWKVPVAHPSRRTEPVVWLHCRDRSVSTSSQSERFVTVEGHRFGHVLDPRSGQPVPAWGSVTVVAEDPAVADMVSTALLVMGPEAGLEWANARRDIGVLFLIERATGLERRWNPAFEQYLVKQVATPESRVMYRSRFYSDSTTKEAE